MKIDKSATKLSDDSAPKYNPPKESKFKVKGFRPPLHLLVCPWAQCSDYKLESSYTSAFKPFKIIQRTQLIRPSANIMRDKESLRRSLFLRRKFSKKRKTSENAAVAHENHS